MKLKVTADYVNGARGIGFRAGQEIEVPEVFGRWLQSDAPEVFEVVGEDEGLPDKPPADKAVKRSSTRRKSKGKSQ